MKLCAVNNINFLEKIIVEHTFTETLSNNYILSQEFNKYIREEKIFYFKENSNLYLFIKKRGFYRLYYLINNIFAQHDFSNLQIVLEIVYRGKKNFPLEDIKFWKKNGFKNHLTRDCYFLKTTSSISNNNKVEGVKIELPKNKEEMLFIKKLIDENLDLYTGDRLSLQEIENFAARELIFCAYKNDILCGMLQADLRNKIFWLGHIVVHQDFRGIGLANLLVDYYFQQGIKLQVRQFQLWVIDGNIPAVNLYKNRGFTYLNKSIHSLLKIN